MRFEEKKFCQENITDQLTYSLEVLPLSDFYIHQFHYKFRFFHLFLAQGYLNEVVW